MSSECPYQCCLVEKNRKWFALAVCEQIRKTKVLPLGRRRGTYSTEITWCKVEWWNVKLFFKGKGRLLKGVDAAMVLNLTGSFWLIRQSTRALGLCFSALNVRYEMWKISKGPCFYRKNGKCDLAIVLVLVVTWQAWLSPSFSWVIIHCHSLSSLSLIPIRMETCYTTLIFKTSFSLMPHYPLKFLSFSLSSFQIVVSSYCLYFLSPHLLLLEFLPDLSHN